MIDKTHIFISFFVTTIFFFIEGVIHYNIGKYGNIGFKFPKYKHCIKIISTILIFSFVSCCVTQYIKIALDQTITSLNTDTQNYSHN